MAVLAQKARNPLKNMADLLRFVCLTNKHTPFGEVICNRLVFALLGEETRRN
jgi:hypothetical protein